MALPREGGFLSHSDTRKGQRLKDLKLLPIVWEGPGAPGSGVVQGVLGDGCAVKRMRRKAFKKNK